MVEIQTHTALAELWCNPEKYTPVKKEQCLLFGDHVHLVRMMQQDYSRGLYANRNKSANAEMRE